LHLQVDYFRSTALPTTVTGWFKVTSEIADTTSYVTISRTSTTLKLHGSCRHMFTQQYTVTTFILKSAIV